MNGAAADGMWQALMVRQEKGNIGFLLDIDFVKQGAGRLTSDQTSSCSFAAPRTHMRLVAHRIRLGPWRATNLLSMLAEMMSRLLSFCSKPRLLFRGARQ